MVLVAASEDGMEMHVRGHSSSFRLLLGVTGVEASFVSSLRKGCSDWWKEVYHKIPKIQCGCPHTNYASSAQQQNSRPDEDAESQERERGKGGNRAKTSNRPRQ